jgi:hypothetical protein
MRALRRASTAPPGRRPAWARRQASGRWQAAAHSPCKDGNGGSPQGHGAGPVEVQDRPRARGGGTGPAAGPAAGPARVGPAPGQRKVARLWRSGRTALARRTARRSTAMSRWRYKNAPGREAAAPGRPLWRPAHGGGDDSRVGEVSAIGARCPARTAVRVGPAPGQRGVARLRRTRRSALVRRTASRRTAMSRWRYKIALGREAAAPGRPHRRPAHGGGSDSRVGEVVVFRAHCPARTTARAGTAPGQLMLARRRRSGRIALVRRTARRNTALSRWRCKNAPGREAVAPGRQHRRQRAAAEVTVASAMWSYLGRTAPPGRRPT